MNSRVACTIVARNYAAQARVLCETLRRFNPDVAFFTLLVDGSEADRSMKDLGTVVLLEDLGHDPQSLDLMMSIYDVMEFSTSQKPALLLHLFRLGARSALYIDPDMQVYGDLGDLLDDAFDAGVLLAPHVLQPLPRDGKILSERTLSLAGIFNAGFLGIGISAFRFLAWWNDRLRTDCISDQENGLFADQRWLDWVPSLFPHRIMRDPGVDVAYWNVHERPISRVDGQWRAGGVPLRLVHFSGYDASTPWLMSKHAGDNPRVLLSDRPELRRLCDEYGDLLRDSGHDSLKGLPYGHARLANGFSLTPSIRRMVREVEVSHVRTSVPRPSTFGDPEGFCQWLLTPCLGDEQAAVTPLEYSVWLERPDLQLTFPLLLERSGSSFRDWFAVNDETGELAASVRRCITDTALVEPSAKVPSPRAGWQVVDATSATGPARDLAALLVSALLETGRVAAAHGGVAATRQNARLNPTHDIVVILDTDLAIPSDVTSALERTPGRKIGVLIGSVESARSSWALGAGFHEFWTLSDRLALELSGVTGMTVRRIPSPYASVSVPSDTAQDGAAARLVLEVDGSLSLHDSGAILAAEVVARVAHPGVTLHVAVDGFDVVDREHLLYIASAAPAAVILSDDEARALRPGDILLSLGSHAGIGSLQRHAVAIGAIVVASAESLIDELTPSRSAIVVRPDASSIAAAVDGILGNPDRRQRLVAAARTDIESNTTPHSEAVARLASLLDATSGGTQ